MKRLHQTGRMGPNSGALPSQVRAPGLDKGSSLAWLPLSHHARGELDEAERTAWAGLKTAGARQEWAVAAEILSHLAAVALAKGEFAAVEGYAQDALSMSERVTSPWFAHGALHASIGAMAMRGRWHEAQQILDRALQPGGVLPAPLIVRLYQQIILAYQPQPLEASVKQLGAELLNAATSAPQWLAPLAALVELADASLQASATDGPVKMLSRVLQTGIVLSSGWVFLLPRQLGLSAMLHGNWGYAESYFKQAIETATASRAHPELGRTYQLYARMLLLKGEKGNGRRIDVFLEKALRLFEELEMTPFVPEILYLKRAVPRI